MEEKHAIEVTDLVISYQNLKKTSIKKICCISVIAIMSVL